MGTVQSRHGSDDSDICNDLTFISECEVLYEGDPSSYQLFKDCKKNPSHASFIPVKEFSMEHLPKGYKTEDIMQTIKTMAARTVRVIVKYTSLNRPATFLNTKTPYPFFQFQGSSRKIRVGSGFVVPVQGNVVRGRPCPCGVCKTSYEPANQYREFLVSTATHVIFDDSEAEKSRFELFYDSEEDRGRVKRLYGVRIYTEFESLDNVPTSSRRDVEALEEAARLRRWLKDRVHVLCVSHDTDLVLKTISTPESADETNVSEASNDNILSGPGGARAVGDKSFGVVISHPHGRSKHITVGNRLRINYPLPHDALNGPCRKKGKPIGTSGLDRKTDKVYVFKLDIGTEMKRSLVKSPWLPMEEKAFQRLITYCNPVKDGDQFRTLRKAIFLTIPTDSNFFSRRGVLRVKLMSFPVGTRFFADEEKMKNSCILPDDMLFSVPLWNMGFPYPNGEFFETYDIDTCPGSSGAPVIKQLKMGSPCNYYTHSGALDDGQNKCALE